MRGRRATASAVLAAIGTLVLGTDVAQAAPPAVPTGVTATLASPTQINLSWSAVAGASAYRVLRGTVTGGPYTQVGMSSGPNFANTGLALNKTYFYVVQSYNGAFSGNSAQVSLTTGGSPAPQVAPDPPMNVAATAANGAIQLSWTASTGAAVYHYDILRGTSSGGEAAVDAIGGTVTSYADVTAPGAAGLYYQIRAVGAYGSSLSVEVFVPGAPTLTATTRSTIRVDLSWTTSTNATSYNLFRSTSSSGPFTTPFTTVTAPTTTYQDSSLSPDTTYYYAVQAVTTGGTGTGTSLNSNIATATTNPVTTVGFQVTTSSINEGAGPLAVVVVLTTTPTTSPLRAPVSVDVVPTAGTATAADFGTTATVTFPIGAGNTATQTASIGIVDDTLVEGDETFSLGFQNAGPTGNTVGSPNAQTVTIVDNDFASYAFQSATSSFGEAAGTVSVVVVLTTNPTNATLAASAPVNLAIPTGSASLGADYSVTTPTFPVGAGNTATQNVSVAITDDLLVEGGETANFSLNASGVVSVGGQSTHALSIVDNDSASYAFQAATSSPNEGAGTVSVVVVLTTIPAGATLAASAPVNLAAPTGSAILGTDYSISAVPTFPAGAGNTATQNVSVAINDDLLVEGTETATFMLNASGLVSVGGQATHAMSILDNDTASYAFQAATSSPGEGAGTVSVVVVLTTSPAGATLAANAPVSLATPTGSATSGTDYSFTTPTFPAGAGNTATQSVSVTITDDLLVEGNETATFTLNASGVVSVVGQSTHALTIVDNDTASYAFQLATSNPSENAGTVSVVVVLTTSPAGATLAASAPVSLATPTGSATSGTDYTFTTPTFPAGAGNTATQSVSVTITDDLLVEGNETATFTLNASGVVSVVGQVTHALTIVDNDTASYAFQAASSSPGEGAGTVSLVVVLTTSPAGATLAASAPVSLATPTGTATAGVGGDYTFSTPTFPSGAGSGATQNVSVTINDDVLVEGAEAATFTLQTSGVVTVGAQPTHVMTIADNDFPPSTGGFLYSANFNNGEVRKIDLSTGAVSVFALVGFGGGESGMAFDASGNLYVAKRSSNEIAKVTPAGVVTTFASIGSGPQGLAVDAAGNVYVSLVFSGTVYQITPGGAQTLIMSGLSFPTGLGLDAAGNLYVSEAGTNKVLKRTPGGTVTTLATLTATGNPNGLAVDSAGNVYAAMESGTEVDKITPAGVVTTFATGFTGAVPLGLALDAAGNLYVNGYNGGSPAQIFKVTPGGATSVFVDGTHGLDANYLGLAVHYDTPAISFQVPVPNAQIQLNGNGAFTAGGIQMSTFAFGGNSSAWDTTRVDLTKPFRTQFTTNLGPGGFGLADGGLFVLQNVSASALGLGGSGCGYATITNSLGIKFRTYPSANATGLVTGGIQDDGANVSLASAGINLESGNPLQVTLSFTPNGPSSTVDETIEDVVTHNVFQRTYVIDYVGTCGGPSLFAGFTGATGGVTEDLTFGRWTITGVSPPGATANTFIPSFDVCSTASVTLTIVSGPGAFTGTSVTTAAPVNGVVTFSSVGFTQAGTYVLKATAGASTAQSGPITIN